MEIVYYLTANGWNDDPDGQDEALETWVVTVESYGTSRLTRWTCVAHSEYLGVEERRALHQRFGSPSVALKSPETERDVEVESEVPVTV